MDEPMMIKIKKCPFCGSRAVTCKIEYALPTGIDVMFRVECTKPNCRIRTNYWYPESAAIATWNKRVRK